MTKDEGQHAPEPDSLRILTVTVGVGVSMPDPFGPATFSRSVKMQVRVKPRDKIAQLCGVIERAAAEQLDVLTQKKLSELHRAHRIRQLEWAVRQLRQNMRRKRELRELAVDEAKQLQELYKQHQGIEKAVDALEEADKRAGVRICRVCGCTDNSPCVCTDGAVQSRCEWVGDDLCSLCAG